MRWIREQGDEDHLAAVCKTLLVQLGVAYDDATVAAELMELPSYPSMASLTVALERWQIGCEPLALEADDLPDLPLPFVALGQDDRYVVVTAIDRDRAVAIVDARTGPARQHWATFVAGWSGRVVAVEATPQSRASTPAGRRAAGRARLRRLGIAALGLGALVPAALALAQQGRTGRMLVALAALHGLGVWLCALLFATARGAQGPLARALCSLGERTRCERVLGSPAARIGPIEMSDLGLVYFGAGLLSILSVAGGADPSLAALAWLQAALGALALPYTLFSIVYQARLGAWCTLCVVVQLVLWAQAALGAQVLRTPPTLELVDALRLSCAFFAVTAAWLWLRPIVGRALHQEALARSTRRLSRDPERIERLLAPAVAPLPDTELMIEEGEAGSVTLTIYGDLMCTHCAVIDEAARALLAAQPGLRLQHRLFALYPLDAAGHATARALTDELSRGDGRAAAGRLAAWYALRRAALGTPSVPAEPDRGGSERYQRFVRATPPFTIAPVLFADGRRLPAGVRIEDLGEWIRERVERRDETAAAPAPA